MDEQAEWTKIAELTTEIVTAYLSSHRLQVLDVPDLIKAVGAELASLVTELSQLCWRSQSQL